MVGKLNLFWWRGTEICCGDLTALPVSSFNMNTMECSNKSCDRPLSILSSIISLLISLEIGYNAYGPMSIEIMSFESKSKENIYIHNQAKSNPPLRRLSLS